MSDLKAFRQVINAVESDNNPDAVHKTLKRGMHKGMAAQGEAGMMPNTLQLMAKRKVRDGVASELDKLIADTDPKAIPEILQSNPHKYDQYSNDMAADVLNKSEGMPVEAYLRYKHGQNLEDDSVAKLIKRKPKLVQRIQDKMSGLSSNPDPVLPELPIEPPPEDVLYSRIKKMMGK